jgi:catechol 2,3-dioxygenase-like lactoylglutathione lyase family enzyme
MLGDAKAVGFIQVADTNRARAFYEGVLGLELRDDGFALVADLSGAMLRITTLPDWKAGEHPAFGFAVADAHAVAAALAAKGVSVERYPFLGEAQAQDGVWTGPAGTKVVWFKDPDGNLLSATSSAR